MVNLIVQFPNAFHCTRIGLITLYINWLSIKCIFFMLQAHDEIKSNKEACDAMELKRKEL